MDLVMLLIYTMFMGSVVLLFSGLVGFFFPKLHFLVVVIISALIGGIFGYTYGLTKMMLFTVIFNAALSLTAISLARFGRYLKNKADFEMAADEI